MSPLHKTRFRTSANYKSVINKVPLCCTEECLFRGGCTDSENTKYRNYDLDVTRHLTQIHPHFAELLRAQSNSTANYLYSMNFYGNAKDPLVKKTKPYSPELIHQRLLHMPVVGGLTKENMFLMLSIILNLSLVKHDKQMEYMETLQSQGHLTRDILEYLKIIGHHPNTGLSKAAKANFLQLCTELIQNSNSNQDFMCDFNYFNPDHIFSKSLSTTMDPYELEYLKNILECEKDLSSSQFLYVVIFVERLQEMLIKKRNHYLKMLHEKDILPSNKFSWLLTFLRAHNHVFAGNKLKKCFYALQELMELSPCKDKQN